MTHGIGKLIDAERTAVRQDSVREMISKDIENQFTANALNVDRRKLTNVLAGIVDILRRCGRGWIISNPIFGLNIARKMRNSCSLGI